MKEGYSEPNQLSSKKETSSNEDDEDESDEKTVDYAMHFDSPQNHHYVVGAKSLNYIMQCEDLEFVDFIER